MLHEVLEQRRPEVDLELLGDYWALYKGGKEWRARVTRFIPQRPDEPEKTYGHRKEVAHYLNYVGPIVNYFVALLFSQKPEIRTVPESVDGWYAEFRNNCNGRGTDLDVMIRERVARAAVDQRAWLLVDFPAEDPELAPVANRAEWEERKLGNAYLCAFNDADVLDWEVDKDGELEWALVKQTEKKRKDHGGKRDQITDTWTVWGRTEWIRYETMYECNKPPQPKDDIKEVARGKVATTGRVPLVRVELPDELWVMNLLASPQVEQCRARNGLSWSLQSSCFAMRNFFLRDEPGEEPKAGVAYGNVYGIDERVDWDAPPTGAFSPIAEYAGTLKDEIYRVSHAMALGVDNNAAAVGRSGESKEADGAATVVVVKALARIVRDVIKSIHDLVALGRADQIEFTIGGMDSYVAGDVAALTETAVAADTLAIPSPKFQRLLKTRVALALVPDASQEDRDKIAAEIEKNLTDEMALTPKLDPNVEAGADVEQDAQRKATKKPGLKKAAPPAEE